MSQAITTFCVGTFFGAALYISLAQHPATLKTGAEFGKRFFSPMYQRASVMQASLAFVGTVAAIFAYISTDDLPWLVAAILIGSVIPFTLVVIARVTHRLMAEPGELLDSEAVALLVRWGRLHWVRTVASGAAFIPCLYLAFS